MLVLGAGGARRGGATAAAGEWRGGACGAAATGRVRRTTAATAARRCAAPSAQGRGRGVAIPRTRPADKVWRVLSVAGSVSVPRGYWGAAAGSRLRRAAPER